MIHKAYEREVAEAMLGSLQSATLSRPAEIFRREIPREYVSELRGRLIIDILPLGMERRPLNRSQMQYLPVVHLAVLSMPSTFSPGEVDQAFYDAAADFRAEVEQHFIDHVSLELPDGRFAHFDEIDPNITTWSEKLKKDGAFVSVSTFRWRVC